MKRSPSGSSPPSVIATADEVVREMATLRDIWRWACSRFAEAGIALGQQAHELRDEALALLMGSLGLTPDDPELWLDARLSTEERRALVLRVERRCRERVPTAYLTGEAWLAGLRFRTDPRALIPRSLIAEALSGSLPDWLSVNPRPSGWPQHVLDLCTGGGSLAILAALAFPEAQITASDLSEDALALARENLDDHGLGERIQLLQGDLFAPHAGERFDLILCNPPYVNASSIASLPPEFRHEPLAALAAGSDGMDLIRPILAQAGQHLNNGGLLMLEIGHEAAHFEKAFPRLEHHWLDVSAGERMIALIESAALRRPIRARR